MSFNFSIHPSLGRVPDLGVGENLLSAGIHLSLLSDQHHGSHCQAFPSLEDCILLNWALG